MPTVELFLEGSQSWQQVAGPATSSDSEGERRA